ncbi:MAG: hypothetical protein PUE08_08245 [Eubacteriales bacterium]|nr:hypothetical protein [Eubacteriales bacterium]
MSKKEKSILSAIAVFMVIIMAGIIGCSFVVESNKNQEYVTQVEGVITLREAKEIALKDAGIEDYSTVQFTSQRQKNEKGICYYDLEFHDLETEYEYEINCSNGEIIASSFDIFDYD